MRLMHGTTSSVICAGFCLDHAQRLVGQGRQLPEAARELLTLAHQIKKVPHNDSESRWMQSDGSKLCGVLRPAPADITPRPPPQLGKLNVDAATDALADLLCNPWASLATLIGVLADSHVHPQLHRLRRRHSQRRSDQVLERCGSVGGGSSGRCTHGSHAQQGDRPRSTPVTGSALIRPVLQGATLLGLLTQHPFLLRVVRDEILRHRISLELLHTAIDPARAIYDSLHPALLSPLAFDYDNAVERYKFDLGHSPWVEGYYTADPPPSTSSEYAQSVWPLKPRHYYREVEGQEKVDLGFVTGRTLREAVRDPSDSLAGWTRERLPQGTLPVAIALLVSSSLANPTATPR